MREKKVTARGARGVTRTRGFTKTGKENPPHSEAGPPAADDYTDLVRAAAAGDPSALDRLLLRAQDVAWRFSTSVCGRADDAEDAMQEALIKTYRYVGRIREPEAFRPWLYRTVRNACLMSRRTRVDEPRRLLSLEALLPSPERQPIDPPARTRSPEQIALDSRLRRRLERALAKLPPAFRMVVFLREMEGLSTRETSHALGLSEDNVKARLHRARLFLQRELAEPPITTKAPRVSKGPTVGKRPPTPTTRAKGLRP
jgi:RNA polymerase sigma-70 factor (ECF subfamily)